MSKTLQIVYGDRVKYEAGDWVAIIREYPSDASATVWQADEDGELVEKDNVLDGNDPDGESVYYDERVAVFDSKEEALAYCENANCYTVDVQEYEEE